MTKLSSKVQTGEIARAKLLEYLRRYDMKTQQQADHFLAWLYMEGYVLCAQPFKAPARRGNAKPKPIETWIGKSHSARLAGQ